jgi:hypothetical protein
MAVGYEDHGLCVRQGHSSSEIFWHFQNALSPICIVLNMSQWIAETLFLVLAVWGMSRLTRTNDLCQTPAPVPAKRSFSLARSNSTPGRVLPERSEVDENRGVELSISRRVLAAHYRSLVGSSASVECCNAFAERPDTTYDER